MRSVLEAGMPHRVAVYAAPDPHSVWWSRGSEWLGRCAAQQCLQQQPTLSGLRRERFAQITAEPRRYGWHATLKAPFRLAPGVDMVALRCGVAAIARDHRAFSLGSLEVATLGHFLALQPATPPQCLSVLASDCVQRLQALAAPLSEAELARRQAAPMTPEETALLHAWGYPWVMQRFRFHFSLTGRIDTLLDSERARLQAAAMAHFAGLPLLVIDRLSVFVEAAPGADFTLLEQWELAA